MNKPTYLRPFFLASLLLAAGLYAFAAKTDPFAELLRKLQEYTSRYPTEKVHIHIDKPYYSIGDDIWLKAYVTQGNTGEPTSLSNILYVELIDQRDSLQKQLKLEMKAGLAWADFRLTDSLEEGNYRIRAYTQWMRNAGPQFFFDKMVKIGNGWTNRVFTSTSSNTLKEGMGERIATSVTFADREGKPMAGNEVAFNVLLNGKSVHRGKATTSPSGEAKISILNTLPGVLQAGTIEATISLPDGSKVTKSIPLRNTSSRTDVQFLPEGGNLISGLPAKVAVKAISSNGRGMDVAGKILDDQGTEVLSFQTSNLGMGYFFLTPEKGRTYHAKLDIPNSETKIELPKAQDSGYSLAVNNMDSTRIAIKVMASADRLGQGELNLLAHRNGNVLFMTKVPTERQITSLSIPKKDLPSGIAAITLFSADNSPIAERIVFIDNTTDKIALDISGLREAYGRKENVELGLSANTGTAPVQGSFSVSVTNASVVAPDTDNETNILTSMLLTSELKGYVERPNRYFQGRDVTARAQLDELMLTQGWRKIEWRDLNAQKMPVFAAEKELQINGTLISGGKPLANGKVSLMSSSRGIFAIDTIADANGRFSFDKLSFTGTRSFAVQARTEKDKRNLDIRLDVLNPELVNKSKNMADTETDVNNSLKTYLKENTAYILQKEKSGFISRVNKLKQVEIVGKKSAKAPNSANLNGIDVADAILTSDDLKNAPLLSQFLTGRLLGVNIENGFAFNNRDKTRMWVYLDGVRVVGPLPDTGYSGGVAVDEGSMSLDDFVVNDIESIEILRDIAKTTVYGTSAGVILITTKKFNENIASKVAPGIISTVQKGYYANRQFYSPKYEGKDDTTPDLRTTAYWNPHLVSGKDGRANISFFNPDQPGTYRLVIEGIDAFGNLARKTLQYQVK